MITSEVISFQMIRAGAGGGWTETDKASPADKQFRPPLINSECATSTTDTADKDTTVSQSCKDEHFKRILSFSDNPFKKCWVRFFEISYSYWASYKEGSVAGYLTSFYDINVFENLNTGFPLYIGTLKHWLLAEGLSGRMQTSHNFEHS